MEQTIRIDDLDGSTNGVETISFSLGKDHYEIDLGPENKAQLTDALAPFIDHARRARKTTLKRTTNAEQKRRKEIRQWAQNNGHTIADNGRIPADIIDAYHAAPHRPEAN